MSVASKRLARDIEVSEFTEAVNEKVLRLFQPWVRNLLRTATNTLGDPFKSYAEDALQDTFLAFRYAVMQGDLECLDGHCVTDIENDELDHCAGFCGTFLTSIIKNKCVDCQRSAGSQPELVSELDEDIQGNEVEPVVLLMRQEQLDRVWQAIMELPSPLREVVVLRLDGGHSQKEIAEIQGVSLSTIKRNLRDAREQVRCKLRVNGNGHRRHPA